MTKFKARRGGNNAKIDESLGRLMCESNSIRVYVPGPVIVAGAGKGAVGGAGTGAGTGAVAGAVVVPAFALVDGDEEEDPMGVFDNPDAHQAIIEEGALEGLGSLGV